MKSITRVTVLLMVLNAVYPSAIPIWELLNYEEKLEYLLKMLTHLVGQYCRTSHIPDCKRSVATLGVQNLLSFDDDTINLLDPYQRDSRNILWNAAIRSVIKLPTSLTTLSPHDYQRLDSRPAHTYYPYH